MSTPAPRRTRVVLVYGGRSSEHGVSCLTAREVRRAMDPARYEVVAVGITREGRWVLQPDGPAELPAGTLPELDESGPSVVLSNDPRRLEVVAADDAALDLGPVDVVLPLLHGPWGEDGTLQGLLEMAGAPYVGAGVLASAVSMDKHYMKLVLAAAGLPQLPYVVVLPRAWTRDRAGVHREVAALGYPVFVKPARAGSSMGVARVDGPDQLDAAVETAREHDPKVVVEALAAGAREVECGVLGELGGGARASVLGEILVAEGSGHAFYDFEAKYLDGSGTLAIPADLPGPLTEQLRTWALTAFEALGCEGLSRVDFFVLEDGRVVVNELNTMPGFTPTSMFPRLWEASGLDYAALVDHLVALALDRGTGLR